MTSRRRGLGLVDVIFTALFSLCLHRTSLSFVGRLLVGIRVQGQVDIYGYI